MKQKLFKPILLVIAVFSMININAQSQSFDFNFTIKKNNVIIGTYIGSANSQINWSQSSNSIPDLCPGDELTITNNCVNAGSPHNFNGADQMAGNGSIIIQTPLGKAGIGLATYGSCNSGPYGGPVNYATPLLEVNSSPSPQSLAPDNVPNWNYGSDVTITIPSSNREFLVISAWVLGNTTPDCLCGGRTFYIPIDNIGETPETINDHSICPNASVDLGLNPSYVYSNWNPSNPELISPSTTTNYTVDVLTTSNCAGSLIDNFTVTVNEPLNELLNTDFLCSNDLPFTFSPYPNGTGEAYAIWVDGGLVYDYNYGLLNPSPGVTVDPGTEEISIVASGTYNITFQYMVDNDPNNLCEKEYVLIVERSPLVNLGEDIILCSNTPMPTLSAGSNNAQFTYQWFREVSIGQWAAPIWLVLPVGSSTYTVPGPGKYMVTVTSPGGCENSDIINVTMSPSANPDPSFHIQENDINPAYYELNVTPETIPGLHFWYVNNAAPNGQNTFSWSTFNTFNMPYDYFHTVRHYVRQFPCNEWRWTEKISWMESDSKSGREKSMDEGPFSEVFTATDEEIEALIASIENEATLLTKDDVKVYPNPTNGLVQVRLSEKNECSEIIVLNNFGQKVRVILTDAQYFSYDVDLSDQPKGIYFIKFNSRLNSVIKKLVIH